MAELGNNYQYAVGKCSFCHNNRMVKFMPKFGI